MTTKAITPLRQRMIEDMNASSARARNEVTFSPANDLLRSEGGW
jgi:hypothetical protein